MFYVTTIWLYNTWLAEWGFKFEKWPKSRDAVLGSFPRNLFDPQRICRDIMVNYFNFLGQCQPLHNFDFCKSSKLWKKRKDSHFGKMSSRRRLLRPFSSSIVRTPPFPLLNFLLLVIKLIVTVLEDRDFILGFILLTVAKMLALPPNECKFVTYWSAIDVKDITDGSWSMLLVDRKSSRNLKLFCIAKFWKKSFYVRIISKPFLKSGFINMAT